MHLAIAADHPATKRRGDLLAHQAGGPSSSKLVRGDGRLEREQSETSPVESERLFQAAFERAIIGIAHVSTEGHWLSFNQRLCDFLGYDRAELAARTFQDVTHPDDLQPCLASFQRLLVGEIDEYGMDKRYVRKDGAPVWAHVAVSLVRTPEGAPDFTVTMIQDINEQKRLEQEREAARAGKLATLTTLDGPLSAREYEVLRLVAQGLTNKAIGRQLFIAASTVDYHLSSVFHKLGVDTRAQAVAVAAQRGHM